MKMYPDVDVEKKNYPLQSLLFGHRIQPGQTKYEYLIEFLQVAIAEKQGGDKESPKFSTTTMFPVAEAPDGTFRYLPRNAPGQSEGAGDTIHWVHHFIRRTDSRKSPEQKEWKRLSAMLER